MAHLITDGIADCSRRPRRRCVCVDQYRRRVRPVTFLADKNYRVRDVVIGQYTGLSTLYANSAIGALISLIIPPI